MTEYAFEGVKRSSNTVTWSFETQNYAADSFYPFSNPIAAVYQSTIAAALARWAAVAGLTFVNVPDSASAAIRIGFGNFGYSSTIGQTVIRSTSGFLDDDTVVRLLDPASATLVQNAQGALYYSTFDITLFQVAVHEIGHALGLDHTTDPTTIMYPVASPQNTDLAIGDIEGMNALYPLYTVAVRNPVQVEGNGGVVGYQFTVTRYSDPATALSVNYSVTGAPYPGLDGTVGASAAEFVGGAFPAGQLAFAAGSSTATLTVNVAGNSVAAPDQGFALAIASSTDSSIATTRGAVNAVILDDDGYATITNGALGIYRFFDVENGTHFYTASESERNTLIITRSDLSYEGIDLTAVATPATDPAALAVYRFFDQKFGTHFYTASASERDTVIASRPDLTFEGTAFYEDSIARPGDTAVYRFFDASDGTHFYTASATEQATIATTRHDLVSEGVAFYAPSA